MLAFNEVHGAMNPEQEGPGSPGYEEQQQPTVCKILFW